MDMSGEQQIAASRQAVWAGLNDVDILRQCIPGCETIEKLSDTEMTARVVLKIGPVKASFGGKVTLSDLDPPNAYRITGEGSGGVAGFAKGGAAVRLSDAAGGTLLHYDVKADVGGKIAQLGARLMEATSRKLAGEFFEKFGALVVAKESAMAPAPAVAALPQPAPAKAAGWLARLLAWLGGLFGRPRPAG